MDFEWCTLCLDYEGWIPRATIGFIKNTNKALYLSLLSKIMNPIQWINVGLLLFWQHAPSPLPSKIYLRGIEKKFNKVLDRDIFDKFKWDLQINSKGRWYFWHLHQQKKKQTLLSTILSTCGSVNSSSWVNGDSSVLMYGTALMAVKSWFGMPLAKSNTFTTRWFVLNVN